MHEPLSPGRGESRAASQELQRAQLEVLKVERRALVLELLVATVKALEQALERIRDTPGAIRTQTQVVLSTLFERPVLDR